MKDFEEFINSKGAPAREEILAKLKLEIEREVNPSMGTVALKMAGIHAVGGAATLTVCPQFGIRLVGEGHGLMHYFMVIGGPHLCYALCGAFFLSLTLLLARLLLSSYEQRQMVKSRWAVGVALLGGSLAVLTMAGATWTLLTMTLWLAGGLGLFEISRFGFVLSRRSS